MKEIQLREIARCVKLLEGMGCQFKIITPEGEEYGTLEVAPTKTKSRGPLKYKYGELATFYRKQLNYDLPVGEVQVIDCGEYDPATLRGSLCSELGKNWGKDNYTTALVGKTVEVLRTA